VKLALDDANFAVPGLGEVSMPLTGLYNVYNALAAIGVCRVLGLPEAAIVAGLANVTAAFGRQERVELEGRTLRLMLAKNPAGANQVLRLLATVSAAPDAPPVRVAALLNDRFADGQDVSWIWDVDFEHLRGHSDHVVPSGDRAADMAVRLKYAEVEHVEPAETDLGRALDRLIGVVPEGGHAYLLCTYTAMLDLRAVLARRGWVRPYWAT
jgi:UDP-N-acetylmuramyl tripeptide synthase